MSTCDRESLHNLYKERVKDMITRFSYDLIIEMQKEDANTCSIQHVYDFCNQWVENHIKPEKFED